MVIADAHDLLWLTASPLWKALRADPAQYTRPAILRFETDDFMEELFRLVAARPTRELPSPVAAKIAVWRRFSERPDGAAADWATKKPPNAVLKLFQPVHGHFHLVVASLVCDAVGRPDHSAPPAQVGFVMRRLSAAGDRELGWAPMTDEQKRASAALTGEQQLGDESGHVWKPVPAGAEKTALADEVILPAFAVPFSDEKGHPRKLWAALVPASSPEARLLAKIDGTGVSAGRRFVLRAVLTKPSCPPSRRYVASEPSEPFTIASYVDPDAPARAAVIPLPKIPQVKELLKRFPKRAKFLAATTVKVDTAKDKIGDMLSEGAGEICTMSIPIITLCAYIVLFIFLAILNLIFFWLPLIKLCFPIPSQLAQEEE
jgi:hypothetical protein